MSQGSFQVLSSPLSSNLTFACVLSLPSPSSSHSSETAVVSTATDLSTLPSLVTVLKSVPNAFSGGIEVASSEHGLPPKPPSFGGKKWRPVPGEEVPHDENAYWPMVMVK